MILASLVLAAAVNLTIEPKPAYIERGANVQIVNLDLILENTTDEPLDVDEVQLSIRDRAGKLVLRKFIDGNGVRPSIRTIDLAEVPAKGKALLFNPFERFDRDLELTTMQFDLKLSSRDGQRRHSASVTVEPREYQAKAQLQLPIAERMIVYDGHDFYGHHRRWDYMFAPLRELGFRTNFMRYSYDFVPVNEDGAMSAGDESKNENWFGFGREIRAVADGTVVAIVDDQPDDRKFDPASIAQHGTMRVWGNYVVVDHGGSEFAMYGHIRQGSGRVKAGQKVKRGETVATIGASGSSMFPHLHFELQSGPDTNAEGLPSTFRDFVRIQGAKRVAVKEGIVESGEIVQANTR
jgi:hypothetical protein